MMKCDRCGWNDATRYYRSVVNGRASEAHLCADCARAMGYEADGDELFGELFSLLPRMLGGKWQTDSPVLTNPARRRVCVQESGREAMQTEPLLSSDEEQALRRERARNALELQLREALEAEDYERAATLRDALKDLDA